MIKQSKIIYWIIPFALILLGWGGTGHSLISEKIILSFNQEMDQFDSWVPYIIDHSTDADERKSYDPTEEPKHYIDIDYYSEFNSTGRIPQTLDSVINRYGAYIVYDWGILPWATLITYDSLKRAFLRHDFEKAKFFAADLSHYVADGYMPLHITKNYNGQLTGNYGIHSRYESTMINYHDHEIIFSGEEISQVQNVNEYIFHYLYKNYKYIDSILLADNYAKTINSNTSSTEYKNALWQKTKGFTIKLFNGASHSIAELIYSAWKEAGSPSLTSVNSFAEETFNLHQNYPNPFSNFTRFKITINKRSQVELMICNSKGEKIKIFESKVLNEGDYYYDFIVDNLPNGVYFLILKGEKASLSRKMIISK